MRRQSMGNVEFGLTVALSARLLYARRNPMNERLTSPLNSPIRKVLPAGAARSLLHFGHD